MSAKTANVTARVEPDVKLQAEEIISELGLSVSAVINSFYKQIILRRGIPYALTLPAAPQALDELSKDEFNRALSDSLLQAKHGQVFSADEVFDELLGGL